MKVHADLIPKQSIYVDNSLEPRTRGVIKKIYTEHMLKFDSMMSKLLLEVAPRSYGHPPDQAPDALY